MIYCTKCGKQNTDTAKFCTGCGNTFVARASEQSQTPYSVNRDSVTVNSKKLNWILWGGLASVSVAIGIYFLLINKDSKKETENDNREQASKTQTGVSVTDTTVAIAPAIPSTSKAVPLNPGTQSTEITISQDEVNNVSQRINQFYEYENNENVSSLLSYYRFPLDRYYQLYNVSYDKLHKMVTDAFNGTLYHHNIVIQWNYSSVQKIGTGGYKTLLTAEYTSASKSQYDRKVQIIHLVIIMNGSYEITSIYPNS